MIWINCSNKDEADKVVGAFDIAISVPDNDFPYENILVTVNGEPYEEWGSLVNGLTQIEELQKGNNI